MLPVAALLGFGFLISEVGLAVWRRSSRAAGSQQRDAKSLRLLWIVNTVAITAGVFLSMAGVRPFLANGIPWGRIGVGVFAAGTILRWWAIVHLGRFFTVDVAVAADHRVVDDGPYRLVRHPSYSGLLLQFLGLALTLGTVPSLLTVVIPPFVTLLYRIRVEEAALSQALGEGYASYMQRTARLIPWIY